MRLHVFYLFFFLILLCSCNQDDDGPFVSEPEKPISEKPIGEKPDTASTDNLAGDILIYKEEKVYPGLVLVNDASSNRVYLMNKEKSEILYEWDLPSGIGNDAELLDDGSLLVALTVPDPAYSFGGFGGAFALISSKGDLVWSYEYSDEYVLSHHDVEILPNGNIIFLAWEEKSDNDLSEVGYSGEYPKVYSETVVEVNPNTKEIIWQWKAWDHLIQNLNSELSNYGEISQHPELIDINYTDELKEGDYYGDIFHANGLEYDTENDLIYVSVNFFSEVWVIDHSTSLEEARSESGGNYGKGGNLLYRFGNPDTYQGEGDRIFYHNHHPNLVDGKNNLLIFSNGIPLLDPHSTVYELSLPDYHEFGPGDLAGLNVEWSYNNPDLYSAKVSGAVRLQNGNTLITQGTFGYWEVTESGEVVWKFQGDGFFWRGYSYDYDDLAIQKLLD